MIKVIGQCNTGNYYPSRHVPSY